MATFTNQATLSYNGISTNSNIVTGEITQTLTAWKDATIDTYTEGDIVTYVVSLLNSGTSNFTGLQIVDNAGAYSFTPAGSTTPTTLYPLTFTGDPILYYINGVLQTSPTPTYANTLTIPGINVLADSSTILIYRMQVNSYAPLATGSTIENTVTITGTGLSSAVTASETIAIDTASNLTINKNLSPTEVVENGQLTYTFTIQNTGTTEADAAANIVISDTFNPILSSISATLNGTTWPESGNYTYNTTTGAFATVAGQITVPAATVSQDTTTGVWTTVPGVTTLAVTGTV